MKMKRSVLYMVVPLMALWGCTSESPYDNPGGAGEPTPIQYSTSRALGHDAPAPPDNDVVFTFISYRFASGDLTDMQDYLPNPPYLTNKPLGHYAYMHEENTYKGIMQPCDIYKAGATPWLSTIREPQRGQALLNGQYMSVCLRPGIELFNNGDGSDRLLFKRSDERYASDPFPINVRGYEVFPLPEPYNDDKYTVPIRDIRAKVWFEIIQGSDRAFEIVEPQLINAGFWGWYHPLLQTTQISYEAGTKYEESAEFHDDVLGPEDDSSISSPKTGRYSIYDRDDPYYQNASSTEDLDMDTSAAPTDGSGDPNTIYGPVTFADPALGNGKTIYTTGRMSEQGIFFFANDYRSSDSYLQPGIYFKLRMGVAPDVSEFKINIPFDIDMKANHAYLFRLTVESSVIRVHFRPMPWEGDHSNGGDLGDLSDWMSIGVWRPEGWEDHEMNGGDDNIGDE
jgi:hypothetical protein